jgi:hypothetical protein
MIVASLDDKYSMSVESTFTCSNLVITTPHGTGHPINLCPETLTLPIGFLNVTFGAYNKIQYSKLVDLLKTGKTHVLSILNT